MKTLFKNFTFLILLCILPHFASSQDKKTKLTNPYENLKITKMATNSIKTFKSATSGNKMFKDLKANLESKKYKMGTTDKDFFIISGKTKGKGKDLVDVTLEFYMFTDKNKSNAFISVIKSGSKIVYQSALILINPNNIKSYYEYVLVTGTTAAGEAKPVVEEATDKTKNFLTCWGDAMVNGLCKDVCSSNTILQCTVAAGAVGVMVGGAVAAIAAVPTAGVSLVAVPVSAGVATIGGFIGCLGLVCGPCVFGSFLTCSAHLL